MLDGTIFPSPEPHAAESAQVRNTVQLPYTAAGGKEAGTPVHNSVSSRGALATKQNGITKIESSQPHAKAPTARQANSAARRCCHGRSEPASDARGSQTRANPAPERGGTRFELSTTHLLVSTTSSYAYISKSRHAGASSTKQRTFSEIKTGENCIENRNSCVQCVQPTSLSDDQSESGGLAYDHSLRSAALLLVDARYRGVTKYNNDVEISACIPIDCIYHHDS